MKYLIFNKETHEYITTYTNKETLNTLDTSKCYYAEIKEEKVKPVVDPKKKSTQVDNVTYNQKRSTQTSTSQSHVSYPTYHSTYYDGSSSSSCSSDSGSSYSDSSSSCDSSSY